MSQVSRIVIVIVNNCQNCQKLPNCPNVSALYMAVPGCTRLYLALPRSAMLTIDCHRLQLTGLNASVYTGLNVQKIQVDGIGLGMDENLC